MNSLQVPTALYQSIQQKQALRQGNTPPMQDASTTPTTPPLSDSLAQLKQGFHSMPMPQTTLNASIAQPIQVEIMPPKKTAKVDWKSWAFLGVFVGAVTAPLWWPKRQSEIFIKGLEGAEKAAKAKFELIEKTGVKFNDVIGVDEAKKSMMDILDFIKNPEKYKAQGAVMPKGVLLKGPTGTGKTMLAKALAGEAGVPFLSAEGAGFAEMFVGVGPARVRQLFEQAHALAKDKKSPVIVFIDEIDTIIKKEGHNTSDEHVHTRNQLQTCMDGIHSSEHPIIVVGTTNVDLANLHDAMLRPGRLERHVQVDLPDLKGRQALFESYGKKYTLSEASKAYLSTLAKGSMGFSGADIKNILNEAAILAARDNHENISPALLEEAVDRIVLGNKKDKKIRASERQRIAYHEMGHAIVGRHLMRDHEIKKVTLVPRGNAEGMTWSQPNHEYDDILKRKKDYINQIAMAFGGRIAEERIYGPQGVSIGASGDLEIIRQVAEMMVWKLGWSGFSPRNFSNSERLSEGMKQRLEKAVDDIVKLGEDKARNVVTQQHRLLEAGTQALLTHETLDNKAFEALVKAHGVEFSLVNKLKGLLRRPKPAKVKQTA